MHNSNNNQPSSTQRHRMTAMLYLSRLSLTASGRDADRSCRGATGGSKGGDDDAEVSLLAYWSLAATVAFTIFVYSFEGSLDALQKTAYQQTNFPKELETTMGKIDTDRKKSSSKRKPTKKKSEDDKDDDKKKDDDSKPLLEQLQAKFKSSQTYGLDKTNFGMFASTYDVLESRNSSHSMVSAISSIRVRSM